VSNCFDHYNHSAWSDRGLAMVLCRNSPVMDSCEMRRRGGERVNGLTLHGSLDRGRQAFADYNTRGSAFPYPIDIVCTNGAVTQTYQLANGNRWADGCCRSREVGSDACCGAGGGPVDPSCDDPDYMDPRGGFADGAACPLLPSRSYDGGLQLLDVNRCDGDELRFQIDDVPAPGRLSHAELRMRLGDADHPGEEGTVYVNGHGPLQLPADLAWGDIDADATLSVSVDYLVEGTNEVRFGEGTRSRTYYEVGRLALAVRGDACAGPGPEPDAGPGPEPDAGPGPEPDTSPDPDVDPGPDPVPDTGHEEDVGLAPEPKPDASEPRDTGAASDPVDQQDTPRIDRNDGGRTGGRGGAEGDEDSKTTMAACACRTTGGSGRPLLLVLILVGLFGLRRSISRPEGVGTGHPR
jgi:MYXO-CTERM domain-containing protein